MSEREYVGGCDPSPFDLRTFSAPVPKGAPRKGGTRYKGEDILDQHRVGICTAISVIQNAQKATGGRYSAEFQYLMQKKFRDGNWREGSSLSSALWVARNIGFLPEQYWTVTTEEDRKRPYHEYIELLKAVPDAEIERLKILAAPFKIKACAKLPGVDRDTLAQAIVDSKAGILARFALGKEWWTRPLDPLRPPKVVISGHAVNESSFIETIFDIPNTWGDDYATDGTVTHDIRTYAPTEAWMVYFNDTPEQIKQQLAKRMQLQGKVIDLLQQLISVLTKKK